MSHFSVAVVCRPDEMINLERCLEKRLEPFWEGLEMDPYIYSTKADFIKKLKEEIEEIKNLQDYKDFKTDRELFKVTRSENDFSYFEEFEKIENGTDEEIYQWGAKGYEPSNFDEDGNIISTYNPNSKWDWYQIGGRFDGALTLKDGSSVSQAQIKDISFDIDQEMYNRKKRFWELYVEGCKPLNEEEEKMLEHVFYNKQYYLDRYMDVERFAVEGAKNSTTYAVLTIDNKWIEPGPMGWFGSSGATFHEEREFHDHFEKFFDDVDGDNYIIIVDCHI